MSKRYVAPPNWPQPEPGWSPPPGWQAPEAWGPPPVGWNFWQHAPEEQFSKPSPDPAFSNAEGSATGKSPLAPAASDSAPPAKIPLFGARARAKELMIEVRELKAEMERHGLPDLVALERHRAELAAEIDGQQATLMRQLQDNRSRIFAESQTAALELEHRIAGLTAQVGALEHRRHELQESVDTRVAEQQASLDRKARQHEEMLEDASDKAERALRQRLSDLRTEVDTLQRRQEELQSTLIATEDAAMLQEVGIYESRHPLTDAAGYQEQLDLIRHRIKMMNQRDGGAIRATTKWTVNGSESKGRVMVNETSKLMLRAYNAEADNLVRAMKPYKLKASLDRLGRVASTIERLGKTMSIRISDDYHQIRSLEFEITSDYLNKVAEEKEREREERARLREERKVQLEIEAERRRLDKERKHYENALAAVEGKGDTEATDRLRTMLDEIKESIEAVDYRAANVRAGYVYVISNLGSFGERMVKIGMTRRLEPLERVRELGDASVPFRFDVHALFFSHDAVGIEHAMHDRLADRRVNQVNTRREFFYATPAEAKSHLLELAGDLLHFEEQAEAVEFHQSRR